MDLGHACRQLGSNLGQLASEATKAELLMARQPLARIGGCDQEQVRESFGAMALSMGGALKDIVERLQRLNVILADVQEAEALR